WEARRGRRLSQVGYGAVLLDTLFLCALPVMWWNTSMGQGESPAFILKGELFAIGMLMMAVNTVPLRPVYPALMTLGLFVVHTTLAVIVLNHPAVTMTSSYLVHLTTPALNTGVVAIRTLILLIVGVSLTLLARAARRTIHDAVALEISNLEIKERQAEMLLESKVSAVRTLVAGVAHEMNTPAGVIRSSVDTIVRCGEKLDGDRKLITLMKESGVTARQAVDRISDRVRSLEDFARLDQAEVQLTDLRKSLDSALALISPETKGQVDVVRHYEAIPNLAVRAQELNQVFFTLLNCSLDAMAGAGTLHLTTMFDIGFRAGKGRMTMELGPPMARQIVERHGGSLTASSQSFTVSLPNTGLT
ncbi:MAG: HAMP domain-containing histidine kinase, partial [bacterium]|nr:HAMP domain-containing histidine kinase [bacterium]